jgi:hypothetical protein
VALRLDDKFTDAAAVMAAGSTEAHLRTLGAKAGIGYPRRRDPTVPRRKTTA